MNSILSILKNKVVIVDHKLSTPIPTNGDGILNETFFKRAKEAFITETVAHHVDEIITTVQAYPKHDLSDVIFDIDVVVIKRNDFDKIRKHYEQFFKGEAENFPNEA